MNAQQFPDVWLTTLDALKRHRGISESTVPENGARAPEEIDDLLTQCILDASGSIIDELERLPLPYHDTVRVAAVRDETLNLDADLLDVDVVLDDAAVEVETSEYELAPLNLYPKQSLVLIGDSRTTWLTGSSTARRPTVSVEGTFGYVPHWRSAWKQMFLLPSGGLGIGAETLTVSDASAFPIGAYARIDDELVQVIARNTEAATESVTLARGLLGTDDAAHLQNAPVELFRQHADIQTKCTAWAAFLYKSLEQLGEEVSVYDGTVRFVRGLSPLIKAALEKHKYKPFKLPRKV